MPMWRLVVTELLHQALRSGSLRTAVPRGELERLLEFQGRRKWNVHIKKLRTKRQFLDYAGRYVRRPPIANHRIRKVDSQEIRYLTKDTRSQNLEEDIRTPEVFLAALADHIPKRYCHAVRHFGLLASRVKSQTHDAIFAALGEQRRPRPKPVPWAESLRRNFGVDPLIDSRGCPMRWTRRVKPTLSQPSLSGL